jgi:hypothetical protein
MPSNMTPRTQISSTGHSIGESGSGRADPQPPNGLTAAGQLGNGERSPAGATTSVMQQSPEERTAATFSDVCSPAYSNEMHYTLWTVVAGFVPNGNALHSAD